MSCLGSLGPISLGDCGPKSSLSVKTTSTSVNNLTESLKSLQSNTSNTVIVQEQDVTVLNKAYCCNPLKVAQGMKAVIVDTNKMTAEFKSKTATKMVDDINNAIDQAAKTTTGVLSSTNGAALKAAVSTELTKMNNTGKIANIIAQKVSNTLAKQNQKILIDCGVSPIADQTTPKPPASAGLPDTGCYIDQNFVFQQTANNIMQSVFTSLSTTESVSKVLNKIKQDNVTENKGVEAITGQFFGAWQNIIMMVAGVIGLIVIIGLVVLFWPGGNKSVEALADKAIQMKSASPVGAALGAAENAVSQYLRKRRR